MTAISLVFMVLAGVLIWGGMAAAIVFYARKPEVDYYPDGGAEQESAAAPAAWLEGK